MGRSKFHETAVATRAILHDRFPDAIFASGTIKRPLKIGIGDEIIQACPDLKKWAVGFALRDYTRGPSYLVSLVSGAPRIGLDGSHSGDVSPKDEENALSRLMQCRPKTRAKWLILAGRIELAKKLAPPPKGQKRRKLALKK